MLTPWLNDREIAITRQGRSRTKYGAQWQTQEVSPTHEFQRKEKRGDRVSMKRKEEEEVEGREVNKGQERKTRVSLWITDNLYSQSFSCDRSSFSSSFLFFASCSFEFTNKKRTPANRGFNDNFNFVLDVKIDRHWKGSKRGKEILYKKFRLWTFMKEWKAFHSIKLSIKATISYACPSSLREYGSYIEGYRSSHRQNSVSKVQ